MLKCVIPDAFLATAELAYEIGNPTALLLAAQAGFPDCVQVLLQNAADLLMTDDFGSSVLRKAAGSLCSNDHTQLAILNLILNHSDAAKLLAMDSKEHQAISQAAARGYTSCVKRLLEAYQPETRQKSATSALFGAAEGGHALATEALIVAGATSLANLETGTPSALEVSLHFHTATPGLLQTLSCVVVATSSVQAQHHMHPMAIFVICQWCPHIQ